MGEGGRVLDGDGETEGAVWPGDDDFAYVAFLGFGASEVDDAHPSDEGEGFRGKDAEGERHGN